ncbi:K(+)/H(+) antiporter [Sorochytrium milnesiophthora]
MTTGGTSIWDGQNPVVPSDLIAVFLMQVVIVVSITRLLGVLLQRFNQPRVIAEVVGGQIPGFMNVVFPASSLPIMKMVAEFGLVLYLFLVGLELDPKMLTANMKRSLAISLAGMILPFGAGIAVSFVLYEKLMPNTTVPFSSFLLFLGVAMSITAFPVLARILTETRLLKTDLGLTTISAAAVDDFTAWCLLALVVSIIKAASGLQALYTFLVVIAYALFLVFAVRPIMLRLIAASAHSETLSEFVVFATFMLIFTSAFFTEIIGLDSIFGGFMVGVIIPHESGFAVRLTEKVEDLVTIVLLPLYFASSGLKTDLALLNNGLIWGLCALVFLVACAGKIIGCTLASRFSGLKWRDSFAVGILMNTKGLVELIVLNLGLDNGVINKQVFVVMVLMALLTTFMTTPLIAHVYPFKRLQEDYEMKRLGAGEAKQSQAAQDTAVSLRVLVCLENMNPVPTILNLVQATHPYEMRYPNRAMEIHALRLMELTSRTSALMRAAESSETVKADPIVNVFRTLGSMYAMGVKSHLSVSAVQDFGESIVHYSRDTQANMILLPWYKPTNSLDKLFATDSTRNREVRAMIAYVLRNSHTNLAILVDRGFGSDTANVSEAEAETRPVNEKSVVLVPFVGGEDDREALQLALRLSASNKYRMILMRVRYGSTEAKVSSNQITALSVPTPSASGEKSRRRSIINSLTAPITRKKSQVNRNPSAIPVVDEVAMNSSSESLPEESEAVPEAAPSGVVMGQLGNSEPANADDETALRQFREQIDGVADALTYEEWEHPEPLIFIQNRIASLGSSDLVLIGRNQPLLNLFSLASVPPSLKNSDDQLNAPPSDPRQVEANMAENSKTTRSLLATFTQHSRLSASHTANSTVGASPDDISAVDDDRALLGAVAGSAVRKKCPCSLLVIHSHKSTEVHRTGDRV